MSQNNKTLAIIWRTNMRYKPYFFGSMSTWLGGLMLQKLVLPLITAQSVNKLISLTTQHQAIVWRIFVPYVLIFVVVALVAQALIDCGLILLSKLESKGRPDLQNRVFNALMQQSLHFHANNFSGGLVSRASKFTSAYVSLTDSFILSIMLLVANVLLAVVVIAFFSPLIAAAMLAWTIFFGWLNIYLTKKRLHLSRRATEADTILTAHLADTITNVAAVKSFGREETEAGTHRAKAYDFAHKKYVSWMRATKNDLAFGLLMSSLQLMVLVLSIYAVMHHAISIGILLLVQVYVAQIIGQLWGLSNLSRNIEQSLSEAGEMTEILGTSLLVNDPAEPQALRAHKGAISFDHVTFAHDGENDALFHNFTLRIKPGEKIGLVGRSGSGKTTLTRLLLRFSDIDEGAITIDGQDIRTVAQADLRSHIAYVPQEPLLFHRSIYENIAYGKNNADEAAIKRAAHQANASAFIEKLPHGYDTLVGERGVKLSGGQRQRIAIARAIIKNAPILVLDEATSALDSESEKLIQDALQELMKGRTVIVIAHRLSTIQKMDRIIVLDDGVISEQGSHSELLKQKSIYASLWSRQSGGFIEE